MAIYAKFEGIQGGSLQAERKGWCDILSLDWGASRSGQGIGKVRSKNNANIEDFVLTLLYDKAAPVMQAYCLKGKVIPKLDVEITSTGERTGEVYLRYEMKNVSIVSYQTNAEAGDEMPPVVMVSSRFEEMKVTFIEYAKDGSKSGTVECKYKSRK